METRKSRASKKKHDFLRGEIGEIMIETGRISDIKMAKQKRVQDDQHLVLASSAFVRRHLF